MYAIIVWILEKKGESAMDVRLGDVLLMKKKHPCGSDSFKVLRVGMDFKINAWAAAEKSWHRAPK